MRIRSFGCLPAAVLAIVGFSGAEAAAQEPSSSGHDEVGGVSTAATVPARQEPRLVRIPDPLARRATVSALNSAVARFEEPSCRTILTEFTDGDGRLLADRLASSGNDFDRYVNMLVFYDGTRSRTCDKGAFAFTAPGSRVVLVCAGQLKRVQLSRLDAVQPDYVVTAFIHEILHTLGLGENPPSSSEITRRVRARCSASRTDTLSRRDRKAGEAGRVASRRERSESW